jgi:EAL domain-containing protein (putative c-di-GMP-specific phosphodiesterase class I)
MDAQLQSRRLMELDLRRALMNNEFTLFYQPLVNLEAQRITGFEALLRWHHPERGLVPPAEFIPLAEEIGLIIPIGDWVLRDACREAATWPHDVVVSVNLSPSQFRSRNLIHDVIGALAASDLAPHRLELEITESVLLVENEATLDTLHQLRGLGVRIAMDDFGTGYSSLSYLRSFPFDKIKIDGSFVRDSSTRADCAAIVRAVAGLGTSLGIPTTAEGVETEEQLRHVFDEGCTEMQGFLFSRPLPADQLRELLQNTAAETAA